MSMLNDNTKSKKHASKITLDRGFGDVFNNN